MTLLTPTAREQIEERVQRGERLSSEEGLALYNEPDLEWVGRLANLVRERRYQDRTTYVVNMHLNYSNLCTLSCMFCAFAKKRGEEGAYEMSLDEMVERVAVLGDIDGAEVHIVGGLHPDYPYEYYPRLLATLRARYPKVHLKAFTAVEIDYFAELAGKDVDWVLQDLRDHGLGSMPGGGAEVLTERIHQKLYRDKMGPDRWLEVHARAHHFGIRTSATLLAGHIETLEERVVHLQRLRDLQDQTGGFLAYIPLRFHPDNTPLRKLPFMDSDQILRNVAVGRLMLDNFDHIKAYWVMSGLDTAARSQWFGADDFDGTVVDERITHMAGCETPVGVTEDSLTRLIRDSGRRPVRRDALYNPVG
ncbi:MAG: aminofutalosine synthase MqnE [Vulcanimicrobiota bacterium]